MADSVETALAEGRLFSVKWKFNLAAGVTDDFVLITPADRDIKVIGRLIDTDMGMEYVPYEDSDVVTDGVVTISVNLNSQNGTPTVLEVRNVVSVTDVGAPLDMVTSPAGQGSNLSGGTFEASGAARILKRSTQHLLRFLSLEGSKTGYIEYSLVFIEMH